MSAADPPPPGGYPPAPPPYGAPPPPPPPPGESPRRPYRLRTRDKVIAGSIGGALLVGVIAAAVAGGGDSDEETSAGSPATTAEDVTTEETETTEAPTTTVDLAAIQAERQAGAQAACDAIAAGSLVVHPAVENHVQEVWRDEWAQVDTREAFVAQVTECAAPQVAVRVEAECADSPDVQLLARDPDGLLGECYTLVVQVLQFDAATGPCAFRGAFDVTAHDYGFEYASDNALFSAEEPCPFLDGIYAESVATMRVLVMGATTYETQIGGSTTAPSFLVVGVV